MAYYPILWETDEYFKAQQPVKEMLKAKNNCIDLKISERQSCFISCT